MVNSADFSKRLEKIFDYYDLNAASFAEAIDVGRSSISHIVSGRNKPSLDFVMKIVTTYSEVDLYWLLNGKGTFPKSTTPIPTEAKKEITTPIAENNEFEKSQDLFSNTENTVATHKTDNNVVQHQINPSKSISRIVIFYKDGTFDAYNN